MPVRVLPQTLINQIAAGEVVVRMASVVKELVENSIDAGSTRIEVLLGNDARDLEVRDNGHGMDRDDAELCLQRHATSKIRTSDDLFNLATRGFRGEALPSIASVSRMEIQTRPRASEMGTRVVVEGGRIERIEPFGCPIGTRIVVRDLFYNTPARRKFLKSVVAEVNAVMTTVTRQALAQPDVGFRVEREGREVINVPTGQNTGDRFAAILGSQIRRPPIAIGESRGDVAVSGFIAHPHDARGDRRSQYLYVNRRPFSSKQIGAALEQACRGFVMAARFPLFCVFIEIPPGDVDFNVHPTKEEVRFRDERDIAGAVHNAVKAALVGSPALVGEMHIGGAPESEEATPSPALAIRPPGFFTSPEMLVQRAFERKQSQADMLVESARAAPPVAPTLIAPRRAVAIRHADGSTISAGPGERPDAEFWSRGLGMEPLGQIAATYIVARHGEDLLLVDQHAAHERLVYLDLKRRRQRIDTQPLLIPTSFELEASQGETLRELLPHFAALGLEIEEFGPRAWALQSVPTDMQEIDPVPLVLELISDIEESRRTSALDDLRDRVLIRTACHSAIRAGMSLPMEKMRELLRQMAAERLSFTCPHGRPTIVRLSKAELDRQFKRIV